ncbi:MAG: histidine phosphatase family protein [Candidatus Izemoplasmatales bacterium]
MIFIYIRHGDPIYDPDSLTDLGKDQAEDVAKYLLKYGADKLYSSTSNRAILTAKPSAEILGKEIWPLDFASEYHVWDKLTFETPTGKEWLFKLSEIKELFHSKEMIDLGYEWYKHPTFVNKSYEEEIKRIQTESDHFFDSLGYQHLGNGKYKIIQETDDKIVMFAHQGFGLAFLSLVLGIPYPHFCTHFNLGHAEITIIEFKNECGYSYPKVKTLCYDGHLKKSNSNH